MAKRSGATHKGVEEKRRNLPIYQHYTLSPGKTKSHHPEAKCNHCLKEFVCGSKQRLIRHLRKCNSITNPEQIIAETLNTLARNSATGQLNHSILEASNLLPSQLPHHLHHHHQQQLVNHSSSNNAINHNTSGSSSSEAATLVASSSNGQHANATQAKRPQRRGRKPANQSLASSGSGIHVSTGIDGKTHFTPISQLPPGTVATPHVAQVHNGRQVGFNYQTSVSSSVAQTTASGTSLSTNSGHLACATTNHHPTAYKLNSDPIDKAYLKLVLTRNLPLSLCDTKEFQLWVKTFTNDYKPPSSINLINQNLKQEAQAAKQRISNILVKAPKKTINLELHKWPDYQRGHLWYAIIANLDYKRFLVSMRDISVHDDTNEISSDSSLGEFIDECIKRLSSDRINSLVFSGSREEDSLAARARQSLATKSPSIVTYYCWWHFTNLLCSDIVEQSEVFRHVMRNSNRLIDFVSKRPRLSLSLEKFNPFASVNGSVCQKRNDHRWYSHLVCYLLEYIKNNNEAIIRALESYSIPSSQITQQSHLSSDNNNNSASGASNDSQNDIQQDNNISTQQDILCQQDSQLNEIKSIIMSSEYWTNLNLALAHLKSIHEIVALTSTFTTHPSNNIGLAATDPPAHHPTPTVCPSFANNLTLSDYMSWFLGYGKSLFDSWRQSPDSYKYQLIGNFLARFTSSISAFKLLFAAYLLNPKHRCAYMTQQAKVSAIEEILNIASEFMPEESDGVAIFDQWQLYLVREEPYDMIYEESRSTPLEWWMSLPCAESIRRVALRILRLKAFISPKPEPLFSQLYFYEDEMKTSIASTSFEDSAVLRYFYDFEDKIGQTNSSHTAPSNNTSNLSATNGYIERGQVGELYNHQENLQRSNYSKFLSPELGPDSNGQLDQTLSMSEGRHSYPDSFSDVVVESYMNNHTTHLVMRGGQQQASLSATSNLALENLPGYNLFTQYIDYNVSGVQVVEEPIEKKKRKWTAQEILSKCQSNNYQNNNSNDITNTKRE